MGLDMDTNKSIQGNLSRFFLLLMFFNIAPAHAALVYLEDKRKIEFREANGDYGEVLSSVNPSSSFADFTYVGDPMPFNATQLTGQSSSLTSAGFAATGAGSAVSDPALLATRALFDVTFRLTTESMFTLTGSLFGRQDNDGSGDGAVSVIDVGNNVALYRNDVAGPFSYSDPVVFFEAVLTPGDYRIRADANPFFSVASSSFSIQGNVTPTTVPVPAAIWLFCSGFLVIAGIRRRFV